MHYVTQSQQLEIDDIRVLWRLRSTFTLNLSYKLAVTMATRSVSHLRSTVIVPNSSANAPSKFPLHIPSRYQKQSRVSTNGMASERSSSYNAIKRKRLVREGRSITGDQHFNPQRATIATDHLDYNTVDEPSLGHCINHLETILSLLRQQKQQQPTEKKSMQSKRYRTISHQAENTQRKSNMFQVECPPDDIVLKFSKNRSQLQTVEREDSQKKLLLAKVIHETKRDCKTLRLKEVRDRYKHLSKSKSIEEYDNISSVKKIQPGGNPTIDSNRRYGRKLIRVCSIGNYQMPIANNNSNRQRGSVQQIRKEEQTTSQKQENIVIVPTDKEQQITAEKTHPQLNQQQENSLRLELPSGCNDEKSPLPLQGLDINCSNIEPKGSAAKSATSFFSQVPSYLKQNPTKSGLKPDGKVSEVKKRPKKEECILEFLAMDTQEIKMAFKNKERRKQLDKWKRNFPQGFFQETGI